MAAPFRWRGLPPSRLDAASRMRASPVPRIGAIRYLRPLDSYLLVGQHGRYRRELTYQSVSADGGGTGRGEKGRETEMARKMVDCRKVPSEIDCTLTIAGREDEVLDAAAAHAVSKHGHEDTPELREMIRNGLEDVEPALA